MTTIQVNPCAEKDGCITRCETPEAMFFAVYSGEPGNYEWVGDFSNIDHARHFGRALAETHGYELEDNTQRNTS